MLASALDFSRKLAGDGFVWIRVMAKVLSVIKLFSSWPQETVPASKAEVARLVARHMMSPEELQLVFDEDIQHAYKTGNSDAMVLYTWGKLGCANERAPSGKRKKPDDSASGGSSVGWGYKMMNV